MFPSIYYLLLFGNGDGEKLRERRIRPMVCWIYPPLGYELKRLRYPLPLMLWKITAFFLSFIVLRLITAMQLIGSRRGY